MIKENKVSKYMLYAIGEIVLVVIGILIALQINNNNELRKQKGEEVIILSGIKEDFIATRSNLLQTMKFQEMMLLRSRDLIDAIEAKDYLIHPDSIIHNINYGAFPTPREIALMGSYDALIGSGKTSIIQNQELLNVLADFSSKYKSGFGGHIKSENLFNLMMSATKDFFPALNTYTMRNSLDIKKKYTLKEKEIAIKQLYQNQSFLTYLLEKTKWETLRLIYQKNLLGSLNKVLYEFNFNELTPEKELYKKYIGTYANKANDFIKISYAEEHLIIHMPNGNKFNLVQINKSLFYVINWNGKLDFSIDGDSSNTFLFQFNDRDSAEYKRVNN